MRRSPHHDGSPLYVSTPTPALGDTVEVRVRVPHDFGAVAVSTRSNPNREPRFSEASVVHSDDVWDWWQASVVVENPAHGYRFLFELADGSQRWLNATGLHEIETLDAEDFTLVGVSQPGFGAPAWARSSVMYQVFPDRFARSEGADARPTPDWAIAASWGDPVDTEPPGRSQQFYGGDLDGVTEHLDHLADLGVTLIYLTPFFPARSNHRYDSTSFDEVDPLLGGDDALVRLVEAAHGRGMRVIGDLTSNHSGDGHEWFVAAREHPDAPERDFYYWHAPSDEAETPEGAVAERLDGEPAHDYESWLGVPSLPKFNWNSAELRRRFIEGPDSVVARWLKPPFSLDGWRIDVANMTGRLLAEDLNAQVRQTIRRTMVEVNPDTILLGESTNDASSDFRGDAWHGAMTYANFTRPLWGWLSVPGSTAGGGIGFARHRIPALTGHQFVEAHTRFAAGFPWQVRLANMNALDTHDTPRFLTSALPGTVPFALGLSVTMPGIPVIFAGDEFGLIGVDGEHSRTPLPWGELASAGRGVAAPPLSAGRGVAASPPSAGRGVAASPLSAGRGVAVYGDSLETTTPAETVALYSALIRLRREHPALNDGGFRWLHVGDDVLAFVREAAEESVLVVAARAAFSVQMEGMADAVPLFGDAAVDGALISGDGPTFAAWALPGLGLPPL
ncbi:alpha-glucosidase [Homoserinimonas aerilata]|uniref:Alpha-glucosidase n=1 Tax=Homoserinimonas aerilata TaxID=1162970 RepID=A0A542YAK6_9MICO|nr:glycoside hydrolase family 13 protein [Homoserinimonas aerilata]TQL45042.1 alpha-glucosidase [Homoserinimonas aerilata]